MTLDALLLSRIQFAFTVSFHIVFPTMSIGLCGFLVLIEFLYLKTADELYRRIYKFWAVIFALGFGMGVVSGLVMSFQFGTNFSRFAQAVGPVIGPIIGLEVMSAFFLEAGFLGIMLFGWGRVGPKLHFAATCLVSVGTMISASFIMAANSWMQTPAGVTFDGRTFHVENWMQVFFNPSFPYRATHMLLAAWITAAFLVTGVSARYLIQRKHMDVARRCYSLGLAVASIALPLQLYLGDVLALDVMAPRQIAKIEAMEGFWETTPSAPWNVIIIPDQKAERNRFSVSIPYLGSILVGKNLRTPIPGLKDTPRDKRPNMWIVFYGFRLMFLLGTAMSCAAVYGVWLRWRHRLYVSHRFQILMMWLTPSGFLCVLGGWFTAEAGRQPFTVYGMLRTADSVSPVAPTAVLTSVILFVIVYGGLLIAFLSLVHRALRQGPMERPLPNPPSGSVRRAFVREMKEEEVV
jgi:cytochrome bd ubiquinol oxidase subunit I